MKTKKEISNQLSVIGNQSSHFDRLSVRSVVSCQSFLTFVLCLFLIFNLQLLTSNCHAQVMDGIYVKEHVPVRNPIPYTTLREADVMWSKRIIRQLDLKEKLNHPLYFPTANFSSDGRKSLIQILVWGFENASKTAYEFVLSPLTYEIVNPITYPDVKIAMGYKIDTNQVTGKPDTIKEKPEEIQMIIMKEEWFFDKQRSVMDVRIIGLCPLRLYDNPNVPGQILKSPTFWIYFPEFRDLFAKTEVYNPKNDAERRTFDDVFWKRKFSSYITKESNVYNDRTIAAYALGLEAMLEGEKIKDFIFKMEHDLWEY
ncbi:MAG: gliding motility protein GldN [Bacteroidia bacterium]|nr:gliding motility protein GldN [Bacteroidia bacterium]